KLSANGFREWSHNRNFCWPAERGTGKCVAACRLVPAAPRARAARRGRSPLAPSTTRGRAMTDGSDDRPPEKAQVAELLPAPHAELRRLVAALTAQLGPGQPLTPTAVIGRAVSTHWHNKPGSGSRREGPGPMT